MLDHWQIIRSRRKRFMNKQGILEPVAGLSTGIGYYYASLEEVRAQTIKLIEDLTEDELAARYTPSFHQIGALALHLAECEYWWIEVMLARREITEEDRKLSHIHDTTETDFALKAYSAADCITTLNAIHARAISTLSVYSDEDLDRVFSFDPHPTISEGSLRWVLHRLIDHEANHKGQIAMMKRLIREP
jgi:uncharacterized damage-inducible protein DinB